VILEVTGRREAKMPEKAITDLRATIEAFASRQAAKRVLEGGSATKLLDSFTRLEQAAAKADFQSFAKNDQALHEAIIDLAAVPALKQSWKVVFAAQGAFRIDTLQRCWPDLTVLFEAHRELVDTVAAGQPEEAHAAAINHLDAIWFRLALAGHNTLLADEPLSRTCAWLAFHFAEAVRLPQVATEIAGCCSGHLARLFRDELGLSFSDYLIELRLQKAAQLLQKSGSTIREIASRVGYADASRFSMHFRRRFGLTPKAHRETYSSQSLNP
jgi:AraC-like DNA-binding protein